MDTRILCKGPRVRQHIVLASEMTDLLYVTNSTNSPTTALWILLQVIASDIVAATSEAMYDPVNLNFFFFK